MDEELIADLLVSFILGLSFFVPGLLLFVGTLMGSKNTVPSGAFKVNLFYRTVGKEGAKVYHFLLGFVFAAVGLFLLLHGINLLLEM